MEHIVAAYTEAFEKARALVNEGRWSIKPSEYHAIKPEDEEAFRFWARVWLFNLSHYDPATTNPEGEKKDEETRAEIFAMSTEDLLVAMYG